MIRILQLNIQRSAIAHELLALFSAETKADLVVISERYQNKDPASWHHDIPGTAAIWMALKFLPKAEGTAFSGFGV